VYDLYDINLQSIGIRHLWLDLGNNADGLTWQATQQIKNYLKSWIKKENQKGIILHVTTL